MSKTATTTSDLVDTNEGYILLENAVRDRVASRSGGPLFTTSASPDALWAAYLGGLPEANRKHYTCHSCRRFIQTYGGLVTISPDGTTRSLLWQGDEEIPPFFEATIRGLVDLVGSAKVTGVFLSSESVWGTPSTPDKKRDGLVWTHLSARPERVHTDRVLTAGQRMAEKLEDMKMLRHALSDYGPPVVEQAVRVLKSDALTRHVRTAAKGAT